MATMTTDAQLIESLGGAAKLAELLGYDKDGGVQRVHNWTTRGIPAKVKLERPDLFLREVVVSSPVPKTDRAAARQVRARSEHPNHRTER
jgi:hypothetical protein